MQYSIANYPDILPQFDMRFLAKWDFNIQPRTKGAGHGSTSRAFYARPKFLKEFIKI